MHIKPGTILKSTVSLNNSIFENVLIVITEYNTTGSTGFVINKEFERPLHALQEFSHVRNFALYDGGPVDNKHLFFLHCRPDIIEGGEHIYDTFFWGGNFLQAVNAINNYSLTEAEIKIFIGYCGWDDGELEAEIEEGSWEVSEYNAEIIFSQY
jgi:putative transcriptional regulator